MKATRVLLVMVFLVMLASCSLKASWDLAGKWEKVDGQETVEFLRNGTMNLVSGPTSLTTGYKLADPNHLEINVGGLGVFVMEFSVTKDSLKLTDSKGQVVSYKRVK